MARVLATPLVKNGKEKRFTLKDTLALARQFDLDIEIFLTKNELENLDHDWLNRINTRDFCEYFERLFEQAIPA